MHLSLVDGINPGVTQQFLLRQPSVVDASVWYARGRLNAIVTIEDGAHIEATSLLRTCRARLDENHVPREITLEYAHRRVA